MQIRLTTSLLVLGALASACGGKLEQQSPPELSSTESALLTLETGEEIVLYGMDELSQEDRAVVLDDQRVKLLESPRDGVRHQALYQGNCWADRAGSEWRKVPDRDFHALFTVGNSEQYVPYVSAALAAALWAAGKPLVHGRDAGQNRVWVNLGSYSVFLYSVWVRRWDC